MARNKVFKRRYTIEVKGVTTNNFMIKFLDSTIGRFMMALADKFAQLEIITMTAEEIDLHEKLMAVYKCESCGATKYMEGSDCLFCAAEGDKDANTNI